MDDVSRQLERSVGIVKMWEVTQLPNGKTLAEQLTFQGVSFWEIMAPVLALYYVPVALSAGTQQSSILKQLRPHVTLAKRNLLSLIQRNKSTQNHVEWKKESTFLFLGFSTYMYRDVLNPVADHLATNRQKSSVVIHDGAMRKAIMPEDLITYQSIWQHWDRNIKMETQHLRKQMQQGIDELLTMNILPQIINADEVMLWPQMKNAFNWLFRFHLPILIPQAVLARHILNRFKPSLIISADVADPRTRLYSLLGHQMGIPSLEIQFGPNGSEGVEWQFVIADQVATWGDTTYEVLLNHNVPAEKITITGSPRHDNLINVSADEIAQTRKRLNIPPASAMVLCASTYQQKEYNSLSDPELLVSMKKAVFQAAGEIDGLCLVVKPHPLENVQETKQLIGNAKNVLLLNAGEDIRELTKACDAFIGFGSTATVDALIANKLTICPSFKGWIWSDPFVKSNAVLVPRSEEEIVDIFKKITDYSYKEIIKEMDPARQNYLYKLAYKIDGHSSERITSIAIEMAKSK